jgi:hypothetical protein
VFLTGDPASGLSSLINIRYEGGKKPQLKRMQQRASDVGALQQKIFESYKSNKFSNVGGDE